MIGNYKIITLCGSTKFKDEYLREQKRLSLEGNIVISVGLFGHSGDNEVFTDGVKEMLDDMHLRKIDLADEIPSRNRICALYRQSSQLSCRDEITSLSSDHLCNHAFLAYFASAKWAKSVAPSKQVVGRSK